MNKRVFYCPELKIESKEIVFDKEESHHITHVNRMVTGDKVWINNGKGLMGKAELSIQGKEVHATVFQIESHKPSQPKIILAFSPLKKREKNEWIIEKTVELEVAEFFFFSSQHSERAHQNYDRLKKIAVSAIKQSCNPFLPNIPEEVISFDSLLQLPLPDTGKYIAWCGATDEQHISKRVNKQDANILMLIGPEGGFSEEEVIRAVNNGFTPVSLSTLRLRSETAAIQSVSILNSMKY